MLLWCRWSWCLPCGFGNIVPYFYVIYFGMLLRKPLSTLIGSNAIRAPTLQTVKFCFLLPADETLQLTLSKTWLCCSASRKER